MDAELLVRSMECEMMKLKEARARGTMGLKAAALTAKNKALAEERRVHSVCVAQLNREVEDLKVIIAQHTKDVYRQELKMVHLENMILKR